MYPIRQKIIPGFRAEVVQCRGCALARTFPLPTPEQLEKIYNASYYFFADTGAPATPKERAKNILKRLIVRFGLHSLYPYAFAPRVSKEHLRVLDVGCGSGKFIKLVREARPRWEVYGVEPYKEAAERASRAAGSEVRAGGLLSARWPSRFFDAVCFWDVFEHLENPRQVIEEVSRILAPGGYVYFLIPNFNSLWSRVFRGDWWPLLFPQHCYHYTPEMLRRVCESVGLCIERLSFPKTILNLHWDLSNWRESYRGRPAHSRLFAYAVGALIPLARWVDRIGLLPSARMYMAARKPS